MLGLADRNIKTTTFSMFKMTKGNIKNVLKNQIYKKEPNQKEDPGLKDTIVRNLELSGPVEE